MTSDPIGQCTFIEGIGNCPVMTLSPTALPSSL